MGFLTKLVGGVLHGTVGVGVGVVKDIVTLGGALDDSEPETVKQVKKAFENTTGAIEDLTDGDVL